MAVQSGQFFVDAAFIRKNRNFHCHALRVYIYIVQQFFQAVIEFFLIFHYHLRGVYLHFFHQFGNVFAFFQDILFQVFPFHTAHSNEIFHCRIQRGRKCCPDHIFFLLCFFHGDHIGEFRCQRKQICAVDTQQVFQFTEFFCISRCQTCVEFYFHVISGKCFKTDEHVGFAAEHILHHPFFDFIFQTCQRTGQFDGHIIITVVDRFHFHHKFPVFCNMLASAIACHASYIRTHVCSFLSKLMFSEPF